MSTFEKFGINYHKKILPNGSELRLLQKPGAPIHIQACVSCGSRYNQIPGQSHLLEHMLVAGTSTHPSKSSLASALEKIGGYLDATTDPDLIRLTISIPEKTHVNEGISILKDILTDSLFAEDTFKNEKKTVLNEMRDQKQNKTRQLSNALLRLMYPDYELKFNGLGTSESVSSMSVEDIYSHMRNYFTNDRIIYIVTGDFEISELENRLQNISLKCDKKEEIQLEPLKKNTDVQSSLANQSSGHIDLATGFRCDTESLEDLAGLMLIQQMFIGRNSPFLQALRYKQALVYGGKTLLQDYNGTSVFSVNTSCSAENTDLVFEIMQDVFAKTWDKGITDSDLEICKNKIQSHYRFNLQTSRQWQDAEASAVRHSIEGDESINALSIMTHIQAMNAERVTKIYRNFFKATNAFKASVG